MSIRDGEAGGAEPRRFHAQKDGALLAILFDNSGPKVDIAEPIRQTQRRWCRETGSWASELSSFWDKLVEPALIAVIQATMIPAVWKGGCDDPSGARVERGGSVQAGADDALTETRRGGWSAVRRLSSTRLTA